MPTSGEYKKAASRAVVDGTSPPGSECAKVVVKALCLEQKIGICVERNGWVHSFAISVKDGALPPGFEGDPEVMAAYKEVRAAFDKWRSKQLSPNTGDRALG
jgi:hypothetical protein